jgi:hypothetical protein
MEDASKTAAGNHRNGQETATVPTRVNRSRSGRRPPFQMGRAFLGAGASLYKRFPGTLIHRKGANS